MASKFRSASVYFKGKRQRFATDGSVQYSMAGQAVIIEDGYENHSQGPITAEITMNRAVPIGGDGNNIMEAFLQNENVEITIAMLNGKMHTINPTTITQASFNWDNSNKTQTGAVTMSGGKPKVTG